MARGNLYERVTGQRIPAPITGPVEGETEAEREVLTHLHLLLNTREGSVPHLPDYGLTDLGEIYARLPDSEAAIREKLQTLITRYEPRLAHVRVERIEAEPHKNHIEVIVRFQLRDEPARGVRSVRTILSANGNTWCTGA